MNLSTKFIFPLFESICLIDGKIKNAQFHADRFQRSYRKFFWQSPEFELLSDIEIPKEFCHGKVKLRIGYNRFEKKYGFERYQNREIKTLKLIVHNTIDYDLKFENREQLNQLFRLKPCARKLPRRPPFTPYRTPASRIRVEPRSGRLSGPNV